MYEALQDLRMPRLPLKPTSYIYKAIYHSYIYQVLNIDSDIHIGDQSGRAGTRSNIWECDGSGSSLCHPLGFRSLWVFRSSRRLLSLSLALSLTLCWRIVWEILIILCCKYTYGAVKTQKHKLCSKVVEKTANWPSALFGSELVFYSIQWPSSHI